MSINPKLCHYDQACNARTLLAFTCYFTSASIDFRNLRRTISIALSFSIHPRSLATAVSRKDALCVQFCQHTLLRSIVT